MKLHTNTSLVNNVTYESITYAIAFVDNTELPTKIYHYLRILGIDNDQISCNVKYFIIVIFQLELI